MIVSFVDRDKLVHVAYVTTAMEPYLLSMADKETEVWCLCATYQRGHVMKFVDPATCLSCVRAEHSYAWHPMVRE